MTRIGVQEVQDVQKVQEVQDVQKVQEVQKVQGVQLRPISPIRLIRGRKTKRGKTLYTQVAPVGRRTCGMLIPRVMLRSALGYVLATLSGCLLGNTMRGQGFSYFCLTSTIRPGSHTWSCWT